MMNEITQPTRPVPSMTLAQIKTPVNAVRLSDVALRLTVLLTQLRPDPPRRYGRGIARR